eukprot:gene5566-11199_t
MYIGPWQEYNLGKTKVSQATVAQQHEELKENLERVLLASLDPISAARAIQAMNPLLESAPLKETTRPKKQRYSKHHERLPASSSSPINSAQSTPLKFPALKSDPSANNSKTGRRDYKRPDSFRSSLSEPIRRSSPAGRKSSVGDTPRTTTTQNSSSSSSQPPYNVPGMVGLLRLERSSRIQKSKPDFSQFWEWGGGLPKDDGSNKNNNNNNNNNNNTTTNTNRKFSTDKRVAQVQQMQQLYNKSNINNSNATNTKATSSISDDLNPNSSQSLSTNNNTNNNSHYHQGNIIEYNHDGHDSHDGLKTPVVRERELTEKDIKIVSKYFEQLNTPNRQSQSQSQSQQQQQQQQGVTTSSSLSRSHSNSGERVFPKYGNVDNDSITSSDQSQRHQRHDVVHSHGNGDGNGNDDNSLQGHDNSTSTTVGGGRLVASPIHSRPFSKNGSLSLSSSPSISSSRICLPPLTSSSTDLRFSSTDLRTSDFRNTPLASRMSSPSSFMRSSPAKYNDDTLLKWSLELDLGNIDALY